MRSVKVARSPRGARTGRVGRLGAGRDGWRLLHVQRNARMHLRWAGGFDTMALCRRRIVSSREGSGRCRGWPLWTFPGGDEHDLRSATPAAERGPGRDARPAQSALGRSCARRKRSPLPGVHHPRYRYTRGLLAMPDSRGRRGCTGHSLTGNEAPVHGFSRASGGIATAVNNVRRRDGSALVPQRAFFCRLDRVPGSFRRRHDLSGSPSRVQGTTLQTGVRLLTTRTRWSTSCAHPTFGQRVAFRVQRRLRLGAASVRPLGRAAGTVIARSAARPPAD